MCVGADSKRKMMKLKYYIFTPAKTRTGGPEALHQLAYYMHQLGMEAYTIYYTYSGFPVAEPINQYKQYGVQMARYEDVEDVSNNFVIAPENAPWCLNGFKKARKCIWWLSVAYNNVNKGTVKECLVHLKRKVLKQNVDNYRNVDFDLRNC